MTGAVTKFAPKRSGVIETLGDLKREIASRLSHIADQTTLSQYVSEAEPMIQRELRARGLDIGRTVLAISDGIAAMPDGFEDIINLELRWAPKAENASTEVAIRAIPLQEPDFNRGEYLSFDFFEDATADLIYRRRAAPLIDDTDTNWLLHSAPNVYLYGSLMMADRQIIGTGRSMWADRFETAISAMTKTPTGLGLSGH
jgi:hypothetical protein